MAKKKKDSNKNINYDDVDVHSLTPEEFDDLFEKKLNAFSLTLDENTWNLLVLQLMRLNGVVSIC